jgi:hypothetical protein
MLLYFLDLHAWPPEPPKPYGMWVSGAGRADIIIRTENQMHRLAFTATSPIRTVLTISAGAGTSTITVEPDKPIDFSIPVSGVRGLESYAYLLSAQSSDGFIPRLRDPNSTDPRNLGVRLVFKAE